MDLEVTFPAICTSVRKYGAANLQIGGSLMTKLENRCAGCGGKFGLVCHYHWGLRFCCTACKTSFLRRRRRTLLFLIGAGRRRLSTSGLNARAFINRSYLASWT